MIVSFTNLDEFLNDLRVEAHGEVPTVDDGIVRVCVEEREINPTQQTVTLTAGYTSLTELRQLTLDCGENFRPSKLEGSHKAIDISNRIRAACDEHQLTVRGGKFEER
jgi:hypothetical protein